MATAPRLPASIVAAGAPVVAIQPVGGLVAAARGGGRVVSVALEKVQVSLLAEKLEELLAALASAGVDAARVELSEDPQAAARALYAALRAGDALGVQMLLAPVLAPSGLGRAVNDRLFRAAHGRVVDDSGADTVERLVALTS